MYERTKRIKNAIFAQLFMDSRYSIRLTASNIVNKLSEWSHQTKYQISFFYIPVVIINAFLTASVSYTMLENRK